MPLVAALLLAPLALAEEEPPCAYDAAEAATLRASIERECDGSVFVAASATFVAGRVDATWERDHEANYTTLGVAAPPRYVAWHEEAHGCGMDVGLVGHMPRECVAGGPPPPPTLPDILP